MLSPLMERAKEKITAAHRILVMSGAGLSTEAGIPDFRSQDGLYSVNFHGYAPERILSHSFYQNHHQLFMDYLRSHLNYGHLSPDKTYETLAEMEARGKVLGIVTQNIDSFHSRAGSKNVVELHGSLARFYCDACHKPYDGNVIMEATSPINCDCGGKIRPDVVLFDEMVPEIERAFQLAGEADLLLVLGTSLTVYPAAALPQLFIRNNRPVVIINRDVTPYATFPNVIEINAEIGSTIQDLVN